MKSIKTFIKAHCTLEELKSIFQTWISDLTYDLAVVGAFTQVVQGDWSTTALTTLGYSLFRSLFKAVWNVVNKQLKAWK
jgi:hypothetical protein